MKIGMGTIRVAGGVLASLVCVVLCAVAGAAGADEKFVSRDTEVAGAKIHYTMEGTARQ